MRWSRVVAISGLAAVVPVGAGWRLSASPRPARATAAQVTATNLAPPVTTRGLSVPETLRRQLQQYLAGGPLGRPLPSPLPRGVVHGGVCYVAGGSCTLTPCVEFARGGLDAPAAASAAVVLRLGVQVNGKVAAGVPQPSCQGRIGTPKVLRVSAP